MRKQTCSLVVLLFCSIVWGQEQKPAEESHDMPAMPGMHEAQDAAQPPASSDGSATAMHSMESHHVDMGPHMKMTYLCESKPGDQEQADRVLQAARAIAGKYQDYKLALEDGYKIFLPNLPQKLYHFTNYWYGYEAGVHFNPQHPTSLLYEKHGDDFKLVGVMYTAPKQATEDELNSRVPLSVAQWHAHVNLCLASPDKKPHMVEANARFGLNGSNTTREECEAAGGEFMPQIFGWMVHVYPTEQKPEEIWSVERQAHSHMD